MFSGFLVVALGFPAVFCCPPGPILGSVFLWQCFCRQKPPCMLYHEVTQRSMALGLCISRFCPPQYIVVARTWQGARGLRGSSSNRLSPFTVVPRGSIPLHSVQASGKWADTSGIRDRLPYRSRIRPLCGRKLRSRSLQ